MNKSNMEDLLLMFKPNNGRQWLVGLFLLGWVFFSGCADHAEPGVDNTKFSAEFFAMDTLIQMTVYGPEAESAMALAEQEILRLEELLDVEGEYSEVAALKAHSGESQTLSEDLQVMLAAGQALAEQSSGAFDLSIYPLIQAWGFHSGNYRIPDAGELALLLPLVDYRRIELQENQVRLAEGMALDLGGIAKGYAAQQVIDQLAAHGVESALISLGGNVQVLGSKPDGQLWRVAVQDPLAPESLVGFLDCRDTAIVTSGAYQRYFEQDGQTYHHILVPHSGYPADSGLISVTVVSQDGMMADAWSTTLFVMGEEAALRFWREQGGFDLILITADKRILISSDLEPSFHLLATELGYSYSAVQRNP